MMIGRWPQGYARNDFARWEIGQRQDPIFKQLPCGCPRDVGNDLPGHSPITCKLWSKAPTVTKEV